MFYSQRILGLQMDKMDLYNVGFMLCVGIGYTCLTDSNLNAFVIYPNGCWLIHRPQPLEAWEWECQKKHTSPKKVTRSFTIWLHSDQDELKQVVCEVMSLHDYYKWEPACRQTLYSQLKFLSVAGNQLITRRNEFVWHSTTTESYDFYYYNEGLNR